MATENNQHREGQQYSEQQAHKPVEKKRRGCGCGGGRRKRRKRGYGA
ncbi:hypothetical protein [Bacillus sp. FJAT-27225]|nr:hypothetical protein [Bacillus sp. FJAT-27225]